MEAAHRWAGPIRSGSRPLASDQLINSLRTQGMTEGRAARFRHAALTGSWHRPQGDSMGSPDGCLPPAPPAAARWSVRWQPRIPAGAIVGEVADLL